MTNTSSRRGGSSGSSSKFVLVTGNTFPVKEELKALGARWNAEEKGWMVPAGKAEQAKKLVARAPGGSRGDNGGAAQTSGEAKEAAKKWSAFKPTAEQEALRRCVLGSQKNLFMRAGAGCGKTTASLWACHLLQQQTDGIEIVYCAFNADVKNDVAKKAPAGIDVLTMNGLGFRAYCQAKFITPSRDMVDANYLYEVFIEMFGERKVRERSTYFAQVKTLVSKAKNALAWTAEDVSILAADFDIDLNGESEEAYALVEKILAMQAADTSTRRKMDFDDQKWLVVVQKLHMPSYDVVILDEAQDTCPLDLAMFVQLVEACGARIIAVGDERQAIYRFRGADQHAVAKIIAAFDMDVLPLMTTFRCGKAIVREAQAIVPDFRAGENNHEGLVRSIEAKKLLSEVKGGDFVISRLNAPLVSYCMQALSRGIPASIAGRDVGKQILTYAKKLRAGDARDFESKVEERLRKDVAKLSAKLPVNEAAIEAAQDKAACLLSIAAELDTVDEIYEAIDMLFSDQNDENVVMFTSTHKAKGRERDRVFLLRDTYLRPRKNRKTGEYAAPGIEEQNLLYVAQTRAKNELVYVYDTKGD
jgi:hypothetical protein